MNAPHFRPLGFGEILDGAFTLYRRNFVTFLLTAIIPSVVMIALLAVFGVGMLGAVASGDPTALAGAIGSIFLVMIGAGLAYLVMWAALTREAAQAYLGEPTSVGDGMRAGLRKLLPLLGAGIVMFVLLMVAYFAVLLVGMVLMGVAAATGSGTLMVLFGLVVGVLAVLGYMVVIGSLFAVLPAIIVEGKGPLEAISRSIDLARGALWRVVGLMLVTLIIVYLPMIAVLWLTGSFAAFSNPQYLPSAGQFMTQQLLSWGVSVLTMPFMTGVIVLLYFDRRVRTEALDVRMAADRLAGAGA